MAGSPGGFMAETAEMYCVKCKQVRNCDGLKTVTTKNNRKMLKGICLHCGTKTNKFLPNKG